MATETKYVPTEREKAFQGTIENPKYDRDIINGLTPFFKDKAHEDFKTTTRRTSWRNWQP